MRIPRVSARIRCDDNCAKRIHPRGARDDALQNDKKMSNDLRMNPDLSLCINDDYFASYTESQITIQRNSDCAMIIDRK